MILQTADIASRSMPAQALFGDVNQLFELARDKNPESRLRLANQIAKLLQKDVSPREGELVADVLIELLGQAQRDLRVALSQKLSVFENVPLRLVLQLANDDIDIAQSMLKDSKDLGEFDLMYIIKSKPAEYWRVIAQRHALSDQVIDTLAETKDFETALNLAENEGITLTDNALTILADIARGSDELALPLLRREEVDEELAKALYEYVGAEIKRDIEMRFEAEEAQQLTEAVEETVQAFTEPVAQMPDPKAVLDSMPLPGEFIPETHMLKSAASYKDKGLLNVAMMMETLRQNRMRSFVALFAVYTNIPVEMIGQILTQTNGKSLSIVAKAFGIEKQDFVSIFMMTGKVWNQGKMVEMDNIKGALKYYNKTTRDMALCVVEDKMRV